MRHAASRRAQRLHVARVDEVREQFARARADLLDGLLQATRAVLLLARSEAALEHYWQVYWASYWNSTSKCMQILPQVLRYL